MNTQEKGACAELLAAAALIRSGYTVYLNPAHYGDADLLAIKEGKMISIQVKSFYEKRSRRNGKAYMVAMMQTSCRAGHEYHVSYEGLVDKMALVDTDTGEVFLIDPGMRKSQVHKAVLSAYRIFPV